MPRAVWTAGKGSGGKGPGSDDRGDVRVPESEREPSIRPRPQALGIAIAIASVIGTVNRPGAFKTTIDSVVRFRANSRH